MVFTLHQGNFSLQLTAINPENHNPSKCKIIELSPNGFIYDLTHKSVVQEEEEPKDQGLGDTVRLSPSNIRSYIYKVSPI